MTPLTVELVEPRVEPHSSRVIGRRHYLMYILSTTNCLKSIWRKLYDGEGRGVKMGWMRKEEKSVQESPNRMIYRATPLMSQRAHAFGDSQLCIIWCKASLVHRNALPRTRALWDTSGVAWYIILFRDSQTLFSLHLTFLHHYRVYTTSRPTNTIHYWTKVDCTCDYSR